MPVIISETIGPRGNLVGAVVITNTTSPINPTTSSSDVDTKPVTAPQQIVGLVPVFSCCVHTPSCLYQYLIKLQLNEGSATFALNIGGIVYSFTITHTNTAAQVQTAINAVLPTGVTATVTGSTTSVIHLFTITLNASSLFAGVPVTIAKTAGCSSCAAVVEGGSGLFTCYNMGITTLDAQAQVTMQFGNCSPSVDFVLIINGTPSSVISISSPTTSLTMSGLLSLLNAGIIASGCTFTGSVTSGSFATNDAKVTLYLHAPVGTGTTWNGYTLTFQTQTYHDCAIRAITSSFTGGQTSGSVSVAPTECTCECRYGKYRADEIPDDRNFLLPVFASPTCSDAYHNDINSFIFQYAGTYNPITSGDFTLSKLVNGTFVQVAVLNNNSYGVSGYAYCATKNIGYGGYQISWNLVLAALGEGIYTFNVNGSAPGGVAYCFFSPPFCLKTWDCYAVDGTVKFETNYSGGNFGDVTSQGNSWTLCCANSKGVVTSGKWNDSIRFFGFFGYRTAEFQRDYIKYATGVINKIRDEAIESYILKTDKLPMWFHERFYAYGLMADQLYVSDYNMNNADYNLKHFWVVADSNYTPVYSTSLRYMKVLDLKFKKGDQFVFRDRCC